MEFPILNKFEKEQKVIELHRNGKTYKEIADSINFIIQSQTRNLPNCV